MQTFSYLYRNNINPSHLHVTFPPTVEGIPSAIAGNLMNFHTGNFSVHALLRWFGLEPFPEFPVLLTVAIPFLVWLWLTIKRPSLQLLPGVAAWCFLADLFLPAIRFDYHDVFILNVVFAGIIVAHRIPVAGWLCLIGIPLGWAVYAMWPSSPWLLNLPAFFYTMGAILFLLPADDSASATEKPPAQVVTSTRPSAAG